MPATLEPRLTISSPHTSTTSFHIMAAFSTMTSPSTMISGSTRSQVYLTVSLGAFFLIDSVFLMLFHTLVNVFMLSPLWFQEELQRIYQVARAVAHATHPLSPPRVVSVGR